MSTNGKACYDKLDKAIVALSWLDDYTQSASLRAIFFFLPLARDSVTSFQSRSWGATDTPTHNYTSPSTPIAPMPHRHHPYQRLSVICGQMKGKMWFWRKKWGKEKKCKKPVKCKGTENSTECMHWWNQAIMNQTKSLFHPIIQHIWSTALSWENRKSTVKKWCAAQFNWGCISFRPFLILFPAKT